jgi:hypothetical protein
LKNLLDCPVAIHYYLTQKYKGEQIWISQEKIGRKNIMTFFIATDLSVNKIITLQVMQQAETSYRIFRANILDLAVL